MLALDEAARLGRPATWEEWIRIWFGRKRVTFGAAVRALTRLKADLRRFGVRLHSQVEGTIQADTREIRDLVEPWIRVARDIEEKRAARKERREPAFVEVRQQATSVRATDVITATDGAEDLFGNDGKRLPPRSCKWLMKRFGIGHARLRYLLGRTGAERSPNRRLQIEDRRSASVLDEALRVFDRGGTTRDVAGLLRCSSRTAWKFLKRNGRDPGARVARPTKGTSKRRSAPA